MKPFTHANVTWLTHWLAVGGDLSPDPNKGAKQFAEIRDHFDVVIDTRVEANDADLWAGVPTVQYVHLPTDDAVGHTIPAWVFHRAIDTVFGNPDIETRWKDDDGHSDVSSPILVHCHMGINHGNGMYSSSRTAAGRVRRSGRDNGRTDAERRQHGRSSGRQTAGGLSGGEVR